MRRPDYSLDYDGKEALQEIQNFADLDFSEGLTRNLVEFSAKCGYDKPSKLQKDIWKLMDKKISILGNVKTGGELAMLAYSIGACIKAKEDGSFESDQYHPFALFIVRDEEMLEKFYDIAEKLTKDLDVSLVKATNEDFNNERKCEDAFENCDIAILVADSFHRFTYDDLVEMKNIKILAVQNLDWPKEKARMDRFKNLFNDHDFPKAGDRTIVFFDEFFITVAEEILNDDAKAYIVFGDEKQKHARPVFDAPTQPRSKFVANFNRNNAIKDPRYGNEEESNDDAERAARGDPKIIFEVVPKEERTASVIKRIKAILEEECGGETFKFPRTVIYVEDEREALSLSSRICPTKIGVYNLDCYKLTKKVKSSIEAFHGGNPRILVVSRKGTDVVFEQVDHYIFMDCTPRMEYQAQMQNMDDKPLTVMSFCDYRDVKKLETIREGLKKREIPVDDLDALITELTPRYQEDPGEDFCIEVISFDD